MTKVRSTRSAVKTAFLMTTPSVLGLCSEFELSSSALVHYRCFQKAVPPYQRLAFPIGTLAAWLNDGSTTCVLLLVQIICCIFIHSEPIRQGRGKRVESLAGITQPMHAKSLQPHAVCADGIGSGAYRDQFERALRGNVAHIRGHITFALMPSWHRGGRPET